MKRNPAAENARKSMKVWAWLVPVVVVLLLAGWIWLDEPLLAEKLRSNPIDERTTAIELVPIVSGQPADDQRILLSDAEAIERLRRAYRWTHAHAYCCLGEPDDQPVAYVYFLADGQRLSEPLPIFADLSVPSVNRTFRQMLYQAWQELSTK